MLTGTHHMLQDTWFCEACHESQNDEWTFSPPARVSVDQQATKTLG